MHYRVYDHCWLVGAPGALSFSERCIGRYPDGFGVLGLSLFDRNFKKLPQSTINYQIEYSLQEFSCFVSSSSSSDCIPWATSL